MSTTLVPRQFEKISKLAKERWGLHLPEAKLPLVTNRINKFLIRAPYNDTTEYLKHLEYEATEEDMLLFFDLLSTNTTSFFREINHFHYLEREFWTGFAQNNVTRSGKRIRIWSAACSNGAEPYTIGIHAHENLPNLNDWDLQILATDLSNSALVEARTAMYPNKMVDDLDKVLVRKYFLRGKGEHEGKVKVIPAITDLVSIRRLNLMEDWPFKGPFDVIFCRNVMIYFDAPTRENLVNRLYELLHPGGILAIGSAETLSGLNTQFTTVQPSVYQK